MSNIKKIVIIGPESTGKSTLCELLAAHFKTSWVPEFARNYLLMRGMDYDFNDLDTIARGQLQQEDSIAAASTSRLLFIDTDMYVMKVWCEYVFDKCHQYILDQIVSRPYDFYLFCNIDLPWVSDELREYPDLETRQKLFHIYKDILVNQDTPWVEIHGAYYGARLTQAISAVNEFLLTTEPA